MKSVLALFMVAASIGQANAQSPAHFVDGNALMDWCASGRIHSGPTDPMCIGYVAGISDALSLTRTVLNNGTNCTPVGVTTGQLADVALDYLYRHPGDRHLSAAVIVVSAMGEAWCNTPQRPAVNYQGH
jgi:Rap1a immunity proteins